MVQSAYFNKCIRVIIRPPSIDERLKHEQIIDNGACRFICFGPGLMNQLRIGDCIKKAGQNG